MANVEFEGENQNAASFTSRSVLGNPQVPGMAAWLMRKGIIKNEESAKGILIGIMCINLILTCSIIYFFVL